MHTAFQYQFSQEGLVHERAFQQFQEQFDADFQCTVPISAVRITIRAVQHTAQISAAVDGTADAFQRTGADETCRFANEENTVFSFAEITEGSRAKNKTGFCFQWFAEAEPQIFQFFFLPFKALSGIIHGKCTAENELSVFGDGPGTAVSCFGVKNTGIKGGCVGFLEPLLDGNVVSDFLIGIKCPSDDGIGSVSTDEVSGCEGMDFIIFQICNKKAAIFLFQFRTDGIIMDFHAFGDDGFQPQVKFMPVQIDIKPLIMANEAVF